MDIIVIIGLALGALACLVGIFGCDQEELVAEYIIEEDGVIVKRIYEVR